ncbi:hypothetical protein PQX77_002803 [Marasmius sp. AFHP31]|nr:hypothetical protein PQX77_002803 [Marasmius sp. AFHP31]
MSTFFPNAQDFSIDGGTFSIIHGNQNNYYRQQISQASETSTSSSSLTKALGPLTQPTSSSTTTTAVQINGNQINQVINWEEKAHTEFDDFRNIKRGDIYRIRNICQLIGVEGEFTTVTYSGRDARKVFEREFLKLSRMQYVEPKLETP